MFTFTMFTNLRHYRIVIMVILAARGAGIFIIIKLVMLETTPGFFPPYVTLGIYESSH